MRLPVAQVLAASLRSARFQRFQQYLQGAGHVRPADLRKIVQHRRCCGRIGDQPFAQLRRVFRDMPEHVLRCVRTARHQRRQWNWGRRRIHQRFRPRFGLVWRRFAARPLCTVCEIPRIPMRPWPAFFLDSEQSAESVCSVGIYPVDDFPAGTYPVGVRRAPRLMPAMRCAHIRRFFRRSQECSCAPAARCEYASSPA